VAVEIDAHEVDDLTDLFHRRADEMVGLCVDEGKSKADAYAASGGRHRRPKQTRHYATRRRVLRARRATANQQARMINNSVYQHVFGFFNNW